MNEDLRPHPATARVRAALDAALASLEGIQDDLLRQLDLLPPSAQESDPGVDLEEMDEGTVLRAVIQCVVEDCLRPAIAALRR